jgi:hypothetical protein
MNQWKVYACILSKGKLQSGGGKHLPNPKNRGQPRVWMTAGEKAETHKCLEWFRSPERNSQLQCGCIAWELGKAGNWMEMASWGFKWVCPCPQVPEWARRPISSPHLWCLAASTIRLGPRGSTTPPPGRRVVVGSACRRGSLGPPLVGGPEGTCGGPGPICDGLDTWRHRTSPVLRFG